jgi:two-component system, chemotaxis family, chemotaxis protein CheY
MSSATATTILIVDDSSIVRMQLRNLLGGEGYTVVEAVDGLDATDKLACTPETRLILCDITMPRMTGLELLSAIREDTRYAAIPVLMLTTEGRAQMIQKARSLGAKGWIVKPFKPDHLLEAIRKLTAEP